MVVLLEVVLKLVLMVERVSMETPVELVEVQVVETMVVVMEAW